MNTNMTEIFETLNNKKIIEMIHFKFILIYLYKNKLKITSILVFITVHA